MWKCEPAVSMSAGIGLVWGVETKYDAKRRRWSKNARPRPAKMYFLFEGGGEAGTRTLMERERSWGMPAKKRARVHGERRDWCRMERARISVARDPRAKTGI